MRYRVTLDDENGNQVTLLSSDVQTKYDASVEALDKAKKMEDGRSWMVVSVEEDS